MQTIPNGRVFNTIVQMKRAGFSMIKKQVSLASPFNEHVKTCQYSTDCVKCGPFVRDIAQGDVESLKEETYRVVKECKRALKATLSRLREVHEANEIEEDTKVLEAVEQMQGMYEILKTQSFVKSEVTSEELIETICVLQSCIIYFDENNQYGYALKQILPVGNYVWLNYSQVTGRVTIEKLQEILAEQTRKLRADRKARVVDFYTCVDIILPDTCSKADLQREEEFNLLVRNKVPEVFNFTEKMLRSKRNEYVLKGDKYRSISLYKKLMSGTVPIMKYWIHSSMLKIALTNGWKVVRVHNTLAFTAQRICEDYIQFNQDKRLMWVSRGMEFLGNFHKLMNNGFYGWFCRAVETYQETQLLMSGIDSYKHFQSQNDDMCSGLILQEQAILVIRQSARFAVNKDVDMSKKQQQTTTIAITSKQIAHEFVNRELLHLSEHPDVNKNLTMRKETLLMLTMVNKLRRADNGKMASVLIDHVKKIVPRMTLANGRAILHEISADLYSDQVNWGRVVSLHLFVSLLLEELKRSGRLTSEIENEMSRWLGECLVTIGVWIENQHAGWTDFSEHYCESTVKWEICVFILHIVVRASILYASFFSKSVHL